MMTDMEERTASAMGVAHDIACQLAKHGETDEGVILQQGLGGGPLPQFDHSCHCCTDDIMA